MANIVLAIGVLMSLVGIGAMATGYPVIEIERGWATVIAGAVLLSGGVVTAALGIVVRMIGGLKGSLEAPSFDVSPAEAPTIETEGRDIPVAPPPHITPPPVAMAPALIGVAPMATAATAFAADGWHDREDAHPAPATASEPDGYPEPDAHGPNDISDDAQPPIPRPEKLDASQPAEPDPAQPEMAPPQNEAWLDQAFQAFDYEMTNNHARPSSEGPALEGPALEGSAETPPDSETISPLQAAHDEPRQQPVEAPVHEADPPGAPDSPAPHDAPTHESANETVLEATTAAEPLAEAPATAPGNLAVIGRYDSDGTSYVMYSDGSIEAQSEAGVYRFGSMAELKAFIEG